MNLTLNDSRLRTRWDAITEPGWEVNQTTFRNFNRRHEHRREVLNCAIPMARAEQLTDFQLPANWDFDRCLQASIGLGGPQGRLPVGLENWSYTPHIRPVAQLPFLQPLPKEHANLKRSPWFQSPSQSHGMGINARHLRYHCDLWQELRPKTLRGVHTTLVYVTPQLGYSLTPHIKLDAVFNCFGSLARASGPVQIFPAQYLYPDARLSGLKSVPAAIFADVLPFLGATIPAMDVTPDSWGTLVRLGLRDCHYSYPFRALTNVTEDTLLRNYWRGETLLPNGQMAQARSSETFAYATLDAKLCNALQLEREAFMDAYCLDRGVISHDGLPFMLPVEMQAAVFAIILTAWELEMDRPGDLSAYRLRTRHAAIRGYNFYQRREPFYSNFMRLIHEVGKEPTFAAYPLASHLTFPWLAGNLQLPNQRSEPERVLGPDFLRSYLLQQLDWSMGVINLWNRTEFRRNLDLEGQLAFDGIAFHQMRPQLRPETHLFQRPSHPASFWPDSHPELLRFDQTFRTENLPKSQER
jgi:hypothetical protein